MAAGSKKLTTAEQLVRQSRSPAGVMSTSRSEWAEAAEVFEAGRPLAERPPTCERAST